MPNPAPTRSLREPPAQGHRRDRGVAAQRIGAGLWVALASGCLAGPRDVDPSTHAQVEYLWNPICNGDLVAVDLSVASGSADDVVTDWFDCASGSGRSAPTPEGPYQVRARWVRDQADLQIVDGGLLIIDSENPATLEILFTAVDAPIRSE